MQAVQPELMKIFGFWGSILALKLFGMLLFTAYYRFTKKVFMNPEDTKTVKGSKVMYNDPDVERTRRAHRNDLENILPWYIITYLWLGTGPSVWFAGVLIRTFVISRIVHSLVYIVGHQQPTRFIAFFIAYGIAIYQTVSTLMYYA